MDFEDRLPEYLPKCISLFLLRDAFKKKTPYGGTLSQLGGEGVKKTFEMSLLKIPFPISKSLTYFPTFEGGKGGSRGGNMRLGQCH